MLLASQHKKSDNILTVCKSVDASQLLFGLLNTSDEHLEM